ncbi:MAG: NAD-dependent epimerase/dehydratase family protein [Verrucomicrobiales bacterium]|jgi:CDP-paratose 2-epimerase|nr:NAD-dependent epimerase/dehydratase family protein [Verrucomicrobiales bacterium]
MKTKHLIVSGAGGLIGSESCKYFARLGWNIHGIDNNMRAYFFGAEASTGDNLQKLKNNLPRFRHWAVDIRDRAALREMFQQVAADGGAVIHTAAQPSHDWAAREPFTDFDVNAGGTLNLLECSRQFCPESPFIFTSTNKVYGDLPNMLPLIEKATRWEIAADHRYQNGIPESFSIDQSKHSVFGASKVAADVMVQEYGRYFNMPTVCFRAGCLTGPAHSGAELHGFLSYLVKCTVSGKPYTIFGYQGKQVRDNIHSSDLVAAFEEYSKMPRSAAVYNIGGGRRSNCSVLEAIALSESVSGRKLNYAYSDQARAGDHIWWISDTSKFEKDYPRWRQSYTLEKTLEEIYDAAAGADNETGCRGGKFL